MFILGAAAVFLPIFLFPENAWAWGPATHLRFASEVLANLDESCATRIPLNGRLLLGLYWRPVTIPKERREAGLSELSRLGIFGRSELETFRIGLERGGRAFLDANPATRHLTIPRYGYTAF